jgi:valyl-tRNA synthetase
MTTDSAKRYDPKQVEDKWYAQWEAEKAFHGDASAGGQPYSIVIPPPNVTGILHMGHALNNSIQDVLIRWRRMRGFNVTWIPGTDHAGIATQNVVEKALKKEGLRRQDLGREKFLERVWAWNAQYGRTITTQLRRLGCACDWDREAFTLSPALSEAVKEVFVRLYDKGLIYRGNYIINWCPRCLTALSDEESEARPVAGKFYHIRYPVAGGRKKDFVVVATTRPETLLGDVAVAVNPRDERYKDLLNRKLTLPLLGRELAVIADDFVDPAFGTGLVKVTPAHDPNDFQLGLRHGLEQIDVMTPDGRINERGGKYAGLDRFEARRQIVADLEAAGLLEKVEDHPHNVGHCYRCDTMVEPRLSLQWFVKMKPLARPAIEAARKQDIVFVPDRWSKVYLEWMENIRDWCISRQIWWGHRIPVFYCDACGHQWADRGQPTACPSCSAGGIRQDEDVLDTWFSSWLWPFSTLGWPQDNPDLRFYYPTATLSTASEILFFWVARMIMAGYEFMGAPPFREVYIHGTVRDSQGRKMSKSLGNSIDPLEIIAETSADALRWTLIMLTATGQDVYVDKKKFEIGRNFCTKLWNAARFLQMNAPAVPADFADPALDAAALSSDDKHILHSLQRAIANGDDHLERYRFNDYAKELYEFVWHKYCDWYVEYAKQAFQSGDPARKAAVGAVMHHVFASSLRLLHPVMPFITEELWHQMGYTALAPSIQRAPWPVARDPEALKRWGVRLDIVEYVDAKQDLIRAGRNLRADYNLPPSARLTYILRPAAPRLAERVREDLAAILPLLRAEALRVEDAFTPAKAMPSALTKLGTLYLPVDGVIDAAAEGKRLGEQLSKLREEIGRIALKLENTGFTSKAPPEVIEGFKSRRQELLEKAEKLEGIIQSFG